MSVKLIVLALLSALIWIVVLAPAGIIVGLIPGNAPVVLQGISGTIWSGRVARMDLLVDSQSLLQGHVDWRLRPLSLLRLSPCLEFAVYGSGLQHRTSTTSVNGVACASGAGTLSLRDVEFDLPAAMFLRSDELRLGGQILGQLNSLSWQSGSLLSLQGHGLWTDAQILSDQLDLFLQTLPFTARQGNDNSIVLQMDNSEVLSQQVDTPLQISLQSTVSLDSRFQSAFVFQARAQLITQPQTPESVIELLNVVAEPQGAGVYNVELRSNP